MTKIRNQEIRQGWDRKVCTWKFCLRNFWREYGIREYNEVLESGHFVKFRDIFDSKLWSAEFLENIQSLLEVTLHNQAQLKVTLCNEAQF